MKVDKLFEVDTVYWLSENKSKWRYINIKYWLARLDWWRAERSCRKGLLTPWRSSDWAVDEIINGTSLSEDDIDIYEEKE